MGVRLSTTDPSTSNGDRADSSTSPDEVETQPRIRRLDQYRRMSATERRTHRALHEAERSLAHVGRDIRQARLEHDLSQETTARAAGISSSSVSRIERGVAKRVPLDMVARVAATVGLALHLRAFPRGEPIRDAAHLALLARLRAHLPSTVRWQTEVPFPKFADLRAWDAVVRVAGILIAIEAETRVRDVQSLQRRLALKRRDGGADHLVLLLADTRHNRTFMRATGDALRNDFPVPGPVALDRLIAGKDPGGSSIILL